MLIFEFLQYGNADQNRTDAAVQHSLTAKVTDFRDFALGAIPSLQQIHQSRADVFYDLVPTNRRWTIQA